MPVFKKAAFVLLLVAFGVTGFYGVRLTGAFEGPAGNAGVGSGAISADSSNNLSIGTTTVLGNTRLFILGTNSSGSALLVDGMIETVSSTFPGGIKFPDGTTQTSAGGSTVSAANVSAGDFGANTGGGNYSFPASVGIGTAAPGATLEVNASSPEIIVRRTSNTSPHSIVFQNAGTGKPGRIYTTGTGNPDLRFALGPAVGDQDPTLLPDLLTITNGGNVGIGTASPANVLEVKGVFGAPATSGSAQNGIARFSQTSGVGSLDVGFGDPYSWLQSRNSGNYATNYALSLNPNGGNVGIGTASPANELEVAGWYGRSAHNNGGLVGSYNNVGANSVRSNPIYIIGSNYKPNDSDLGNMYGIGYSHTNSSFAPAGVSGWGMYVAADGDARVWLSGSTGAGYFAGPVTVATPTANDHAATKAYVDSVVGVQYMGRTSASYNGDLDGLTGANAKCNAQYAGSHMCTQGEFLRSGTTSGDFTYGWIACEFVYGSASETCQTVTQSLWHSAHASCVQWQSPSSGARGPSMRASDANVLDRTCDTSITIHCCK